MNKNKMKKMFFLLLVVIQGALSILNLSNSFAQTVGDFTVLKKFPGRTVFKSTFIHRFEKLIYFPNLRPDEFRVLDFYGSERVMTTFSENLTGGNLANIEDGYIYVLDPVPFGTNDAVYYSHIAGSNGGFFKLTVLS